MSERADMMRDKRRRFAAPGSRHDTVVRTLQIVLPAIVGALVAILALAPLADDNEVSFVLAKDRVQVAKERMRVSEALYRGENDKGQPFWLRAGSAVQKTSREPVVEMKDLSARILLSDGPALFTAERGRYDMESETVKIEGPIKLSAAGGYRLETRDVNVDLGERRLASEGRVSGRTSIGTFSADQLRADINERTITLRGNARLRIRQGAL